MTVPAATLARRIFRAVRWLLLGGLTAVFLLITGSSVVLLATTLVLLPGLLAQGGIAEEVLFRGYLFGHLRR